MCLEEQLHLGRRSSLRVAHAAWPPGWMGSEGDKMGLGGQQQQQQRQSEGLLLIVLDRVKLLGHAIWGIWMKGDRGCAKEQHLQAVGACGL